MGVARDLESWCLSLPWDLELEPWSFVIPCPLDRRRHDRLDQPLVRPPVSLREQHQVALDRIEPWQRVHFEEVGNIPVEAEVDAGDVAAAQRVEGGEGGAADGL